MGIKYFNSILNIFNYSLSLVMISLVTFVNKRQTQSENLLSIISLILFVLLYLVVIIYYIFNAFRVIKRIDKKITKKVKYRHLDKFLVIGLFFVLIITLIFILISEGPYTEFFGAPIIAIEFLLNVGFCFYFVRVTKKEKSVKHSTSKKNKSNYLSS